MSVAEIPRRLASGRLEFDVAIVRLAPPVRKGAAALGVSVDVTGRRARRAADHRRGEPPEPRTCGETWTPAERIDCFVEIDTPVGVRGVRPQGAWASRWPATSPRLIDQRSTLQAGLCRRIRCSRT